MIKNRIKILTAVFTGLIIFDFIKFLSVGGPNIVNWQSPVHYLWVLSAIILLILGISLDKQMLWYGIFFLYFVIFTISLINQYANFTPILTYNCMLFNALLTSIYLVGGGDKINRRT